MTKRKIISVTLTELDPYELEGTLVQVRDRIDAWIVEHGPETRLNWEPDHWPQYNDSPSPQFSLRLDREETDAELDARILKEAADRASQLVRDRAELKRLQDKLMGVK